MTHLRSRVPQKFQKIWMHYDNDATTYISSTQLIKLVQSIEEPWGYGKGYHATKRELKDRIESLKLPM